MFGATASVFLQSVMHDVDAWKGFEIIRHLSIRNKGRIELTSLPSARAERDQPAFERDSPLGKTSKLSDVTSRMSRT